MPLDIGRYLKDTTHLSTVEHGAYLLLIMDYWNKGSLPTDDRKLAAIAKLSPKQWGSMKATIAEFFRSDWTHKKVEAELKEAKAKYGRRAKAGHRGGIQKSENELARAAKDDGNASSNATPIATHNTQVTPSDEGMWVSVRERVVAAFVAANSPNTPDTAWAEVWKQRGYNPEICLAVVRKHLAKKNSIFNLKYFDQAIADAHLAPIAQARDGPTKKAARENPYFDGLTGRKPYDEQPDDPRRPLPDQSDETVGRQHRGPPALEAKPAAGRARDVFDIEGLGAIGRGASRTG